jgi:hypothetical protein
MRANLKYQLRAHGAGRGGEDATAEQILGDPIGREALLEHLANDMIPYTPDELVAMVCC